MVIDTSARIAILLQEPEAVALVDAIVRDPIRLLSTASWVEASIVVAARHGAAGLAELDRLLSAANVQLVPLSAEHAEAARDAWLRYGKGRHPAALNYGDWFSYALARCSRQPLLFKGDDFPRTDVEPVRLGELQS